MIIKNSTLIFSVSIDSYTGFALFRRSTVPEFSIHIFYWALPHHLEITNTVYGCLASWYISNYIELVHYDDVIMDTITSLITSLTIVYSTVHWDADQRKHQSSASLAFVWGIHRGPVNSPHKWPVTRKMFPFDDVIMYLIWKRDDFMVAAGNVSLRCWNYFNSQTSYHIA